MIYLAPILNLTVPKIKSRSKMGLRQDGVQRLIIR